MRLIVLFLVGIALPNVNLKYLLLEIDGDVTAEVEPESDTEVENEAAPQLIPLAKDDDSTGDIKIGNNNVDEGTSGPSQDYKDDSDDPNAASEKSKSKPSEKKPSKKNQKNAGARSLGGSSLKSHPKRKLVNAKKCGYTTGFNQKIVGGEDAFVKDFPWLVLIGSSDSADWPVDTTGRVAKYTCGGSLITMSVVLTAAHCLHPKGSDIHYDKLRVKIGADSRDQQDGFEEIDVIKKIAHEKYEPDPEFKNDIALLKLKHAYDNKGKEFQANTICLPFDEKPNEKYLGADVTVAGWGFVKDGIKLANQLQKLVTKVMPYAKCQQAHADNYSPVLEGNNVCAGGEKGEDSCGGDSGGPLIIERKKANKPRKSWTQIGLVSWGIACGTPGVPGVYTNVQHYLKWILDHL